jgi:hypothetical protein
MGHQQQHAGHDRQAREREQRGASTESLCRDTYAPCECPTGDQRQGHERPDAGRGQSELCEVERQQDAEIAVRKGPHALRREDGEHLAIGLEPAHVVARLHE